jgi:uncharacterized protein (DUF1015 family)
VPTIRDGSAAARPAASPSLQPLVRPFSGIRPVAGYAQMIAAPPYDVLTTEEARARVHDNPWNFLRVSMPEIELPPETEPYAPEVYAKAAENMGRMLEDGVLRRDPGAHFYIYRAELDGHVQTGVVIGASVAAYESGRIRKHELTQPAKETDRARQIEAVGAHTGPVMMFHRADHEIAAIISEIVAREPDSDVKVEDVGHHQVWVVSDAGHIERISAAFDAMDAIYIADGHHRSAAAQRVAEHMRAANPSGSDDAPYNFFLGVSFPDDEVQILDYNRVVKDLGGYDVDAFLAEVAKRFSLVPSKMPVRPARVHEFGMYVNRQWYSLRLRDAPPDGAPAAERLDVGLLTTHLLDPVLGIRDSRGDPRIDFVGGARGLGELVRRVDSGEMAVAFALYPTSVADLIAVADKGGIMPTKSTWFEPKLMDGLVSLPLD